MAKQSSSSKKPSPRERSDAIRAALTKASEFLSEEVLLAVQEAAADNDTWHKALLDPWQFLESKGIAVPDGLLISFLTAPLESSQIRGPGFEVRCPDGLLPVVVQETVSVCTKWIKIEKCVQFPNGERDCVTVFEGCVAGETRREPRFYCGIGPRAVLP
jgi:hypothetical protein